MAQALLLDANVLLQLLHVGNVSRLSRLDGQSLIDLGLPLCALRLLLLV